MKRSILTIALLLMTSNSYAVVGNKATLREGGPEAVCLTTNRVNGKILGICSATLVAPNKILTAGHCSPQPGQDVTVQCGYQGFDADKLSFELTASGTKVFTQGVHFKETAKASAFYKDLSRDEAILILDRNLKARPVPVRAEVNFADATNCVIAGYGRTNDATAGILRQGVFGVPGYFADGGIVAVAQFRVKGLRPQDLQTMEGIKSISEKNFLTEGIANAMGRPGDSGAPLLCGGKNGMYVAGVFSFVSMVQNPNVAAGSDTAINHYSAFYTSRPVLLEAIKQKVAPAEEAFQRPAGDRIFTIPGMN